MEISGFPRGGVHVSKRGVRVGAPFVNYVYIGI